MSKGEKPVVRKQKYVYLIYVINQVLILARVLQTWHWKDSREYSFWKLDAPFSELLKGRKIFRWQNLYCRSLALLGIFCAVSTSKIFSYGISRMEGCNLSEAAYFRCSNKDMFLLEFNILIQNL